MGLDKENRNFYYNVGRTTAIVEVMNGLPTGFVSKVFDNARLNLPYQLNKALMNERHILHRELLEPSLISLMDDPLPTKIMSTNATGGCRFWAGYYHQKAYLQQNYKKLFENVETTIEEHIPERVEVPEGFDNALDSLRR